MLEFMLFLCSVDCILLGCLFLQKFLARLQNVCLFKGNNMFNDILFSMCQKKNGNNFYRMLVSVSSECVFLYLKKSDVVKVKQSV